MTLEEAIAITKPHYDKVLAENRIKRLEAALEEIEWLVDNEADVDGGTPNFAMRVLVTVRNAMMRGES
jgi:hypothetical protein